MVLKSHDISWIGKIMGIPIVNVAGPGFFPPACYQQSPVMVMGWWITLALAFFLAVFHMVYPSSFFFEMWWFNHDIYWYEIGSLPALINGEFTNICIYIYMYLCLCMCVCGGVTRYWLMAFWLVVSNVWISNLFGTFALSMFLVCFLFRSWSQHDLSEMESGLGIVPKSIKPTFLGKTWRKSWYFNLFRTWIY